jgi:hypothetical protein
MKIFLVGFNPVRRDFSLGGRQIKLSAANQVTQMILECVLYLGVPDGRLIGLRPQVVDVVRPSTS